jgi:cell division control protein 24
VELEKLLANSEQAWSFFEGCRLLLDGAMSVAALMIKPVQRICQYPMLLGELAKISGEGHADYAQVVQAAAKMKLIALAINESKRLREEVALVQQKIEGWRA